MYKCGKNGVSKIKSATENTVNKHKF